MWGFSSTFGQILDQYQTALLDENQQETFDCAYFKIPKHLWQKAKDQAKFRVQIADFWKAWGLDLRLGIVAHLGSIETQELTQGLTQDLTQGLTQELMSPRLWIDIGTDHAKLPVAMVSSQFFTYALGIDIHPNTSKIALKHIGSTKSVYFQIANGFHYTRPLEMPAFSENEKQVVSICGMGGLTMIEILKDIPSQVSRLILQPNSHIDELKNWLKTHNLNITKEVLILNDQRMYLSLVIDLPKKIPNEILDEKHLYEKHLYGNHLYEIPLLAWQISVLEKNYPKITQAHLKQHCEAQIQALKQKYMVFSQT